LLPAFFTAEIAEYAKKTTKRRNATSSPLRDLAVLGSKFVQSLRVPNAVV